MSERKPVLNNKDLDRVGRRWYMGVENYNYESQMAGSVVYALEPALRKIYQEDDEFVEALENHFNYFNTMPWMGNLVLGAALAIEDNRGLEGKEAVQNLKVSLMGPLAGVGDSIFFVLIPTIFGSIGGYMALEGNPMGLIAWLVYSVCIFCMRPKMVSVGYRSGMSLFSNLGQKISAFTESISAMGLMVIGCLIASTSKIVTPLTFSSGEVTKGIQEILDTILPSMIPVILLLVICGMLRKKIRLTWIIWIIIFASWIFAAFGLLA
ncbi:MAG: PTS system mannose/fructose/sorbose family transporter subunit IID [Lachnospiraceae bacterium]|jgi:PTS system mannose-specific IID component|nr:PTS system mannose/fructose/sorbose family transporter subunit IID [Lachnospiraceae bacterium]MCI8959810.1 PTS system mannose/fructose/sorbose family transporter subunit IID [Lachnospiraceae bacterium]